jgi:hypothetical protein
MSRRVLAGMLAAAFWAVPFAGERAAASEAEDAAVRAYAADFDEFIAFVGAVPLSPDQRREVAAQTAVDFRANPDSVRVIDANARKVMAKLQAGDTAFVAEQRESLRLQMAALPESNLGHRLVERNDPTVIFDRTHGRLVTASSFAALRRGCVWLAGILGVPAPRADAIDRERAELRSGYDRLSVPEQDAFAHFGRTLPLTIAAYDKASPEQRAQFVKAVRPFAREGTQLVPLTATVLAQANGAIESQRINNSIVLMSTFNYNMLYRRGYYH